MSEVETAEPAAEAAPERASRYGVPAELDGEQPVVFPSAAEWFDTALAILQDGYTMCVDLTAVDYLTYPAARPLPADIVGERFEVVALFADLTENSRIRARVQVPASDPTLDSIVQLFPGADFSEREMFDMLGIEFANHPDLSRILMPETWQGHPLRKDYDIGSIPVQFKGAPGPR